MNEDVKYMFYHKIEVYAGEHYGYDKIYFRLWKDLPWSLMCKYKWYFEYRAALLKVNYPKYKVDHTWGKYEKKGKSRMQHFNTKYAAAKGQVTKLENQIAKAELSWNKLFPIKDDPIYNKYLKKLSDKKSELLAIEKDIENLKNKTND